MTTPRHGWQAICAAVVWTAALDQLVEMALDGIFCEASGPIGLAGGLGRLDDSLKAICDIAGSKTDETTNDDGQGARAA